MAAENNGPSPPEVDLDKTDRLPILDPVAYEASLEDDAVRMDTSTTASLRIPAEPVHPPSVDLPSLAESLRAVEERIARQQVEYDALEAAYGKARDGESAATARARELAAELTDLGARTAAERGRAADLEQALAEQAAALETARGLAAQSALEQERLTAQAARSALEQERLAAQAAQEHERQVARLAQEHERHRAQTALEHEKLAAQAAQELERLRGEARALRASLEAREAQLTALQGEHAQVVPALEARSRNAAQLESDLAAARQQNEAARLELQTAQQRLSALGTQFRRSEADLVTARRDLAVVKAQAASYLERLASREWRRGFDQNQFLDMDAKVGAAQQREAAEFAARESARAALAEQMAALAAHDAAAAEARAADAAEISRVRESLAAAEAKQAELAAGLDSLREQALARDAELALLTTQLQDARRPAQTLEAEMTRLQEELASKAASVEHAAEENRGLRAALDRTRTALEEREFLIRRLERSESNNANVLGRIQTSIERMGVGLPTGGSTAAPPEYSAELVRVDGGRSTVHALSRRTRIGRAPGCELQVDYSSVSRHHALVLLGPRDVIIEDLNSTNGVIVNGRKISRQLLNDGDMIMIGEVHFRLAVQTLPPGPEAASGGPAQAFT